MTMLFPNRVFYRTFLLSFLIVFVTPKNVPNDMLEEAMEILRAESPTHYRDGRITNAQLIQSDESRNIYRLTLDLEINCEIEQGRSIECPREFRIIDIDRSRDKENSKVQTRKNSEDVVSEKVEKADKSEKKDWCAGCPYELNKDLPGLKVFGDEVVEAMDKAKISEFKHKLVEIVQVFRSVPPGSVVVRYEILMKIGLTNCPKLSTNEAAECTVSEQTELCLVTIDDQYLTPPKTRKIVKNNCTESPHSEITLQKEPEPEITTTSRENPFSGEIEQKEISKEPSTPVMNSVAEKENKLRLEGKFRGFDQYLENFSLEIKDEVATTQESRIPIVEQVIYREKKIDRVKPTFYNRKKRQLPLSPTMIRKLAQIAVEILDDLDSDNHKRVVLNVLHHFQDVINGTQYERLVVEVGNTHCAEKSALKPDCMASLVGPAKTCKIMLEITDKTRPLARPSIKSAECAGKDEVLRMRKKRLTTPENIFHKNINESEVQYLVKQGFEKISEKFAGPHSPILTEITEAKVIPGESYNFTVKIGISNCTKTAKENCQLQANSEIKKCVIEYRFDKTGQDPEIHVECEDQVLVKKTQPGFMYSRKSLQQADWLKHDRMFREFQDKYQKRYESEAEKERRFEIFRENMGKAKKLQDMDAGTAEYGATMFADLTAEEFRKFHTGLKIGADFENRIPLPKAKIPNVELPEGFDWRKSNVVTPVKNQGLCGSCWAFSVTGNVESLYAIKHGKLLSLSEQELVDCDKMDEGCNGGLPSTAYEAIEQLGGLETEDDYPYDGRNEKCHFKKSLAKVQVVSAVNITSNETQMAQWLISNGPISIGINANAMQFYMGGISYPYEFLCSPKNLDHGVLIVGFGIKRYPLFKKTMPFWIIKNSWGKNWGEQGYYRLYRGEGVCGVNQMATSAVVA